MSNQWPSPLELDHPEMGVEVFGNGNQTKYPIVETFYSLQGEGSYAGVPTYFIRLGGCNVGKNNVAEKIAFPILKTRPETGMCRAYNGDVFVCDTPYQAFDFQYLTTIMNALKAACGSMTGANVCITGGEPFIYDLRPLLGALHEQGTLSLQSRITFETSGTKPIPPYLTNMSTLFKAFEGGPLVKQQRCHVVCSPKAGFLADNVDMIDEYRFLVGENKPSATVFAQITEFMSRNGIYDQPVWISPVADPADNFSKAAAICVELCLRYAPLFRLSLQTHKVLKVR